MFRFFSGPFLHTENVSLKCFQHENHYHNKCLAKLPVGRDIITRLQVRSTNAMEIEVEDEHQCAVHEFTSLDCLCSMMVVVVVVMVVTATMSTQYLVFRAFAIGDNE